MLKSDWKNKQKKVNMNRKLLRENIEGSYSVLVLDNMILNELAHFINII